jgi:hypothetical protein
MIHSDDQNRFLRSALKAGLRLQQRAGNSEAGSESSPPSEGVAVLKRIKASLQKRNRRRQIP